jgi:hypothetical protein
LGAGPRDLLERGRLEESSRRGGDMEEVGEPALGGRHEDEEEDRVERLNDVRKRRALAVRSVGCGMITTGRGR